mmetsp:Transcript_5461/g.16755  ORF Transcript_5461/g.16755 Transcript_5461/m.16755 type:complete len:118 (+) Transcript_5461:447-800(+)
MHRSNKGGWLHQCVGDQLSSPKANRQTKHNTCEPKCAHSAQELHTSATFDLRLGVMYICVTACCPRKAAHLSQSSSSTCIRVCAILFLLHDNDLFLRCSFEHLSGRPNEALSPPPKR